MRAVAAALVMSLAWAQTPTFRSRADGIPVPVSVMSANRPVTGLTEADFELLDNGVAQTIAVSRLEDLPIDVTIVLDASGSVKGAALERMKRDVRAIGADLRAGDRVRILTFGDNVQAALPFTAGGAPLTIDRIDAGGATSLYSALAASLIVDPAATRPHLVLALTDGRDNASLLDAGAVLALAGRSNACLYLALVDANRPAASAYPPGRAPVGAEETTVLRPEQKGIYEGVSAIRRTMGPYAGGPNLSALKGIAARTGGVVYEDARDDALPELFRRAISDFRGSYLLSYTPSNIDTGWHDVSVRVKGRRYVIRARKGYDGG